MKKIALLFCIILMMTIPVMAESPNFLRITPSSRAGGLGGTIGLVAGSSPTGAIMNPASAGLYAYSHVLGAEFQPVNSDWLNGYGSGVTYSALAVNTGLPIQTGGLPITIGVAFHKVDMEGNNDFNFNWNGPAPLCVCQVYGQSTGLSLAAALDTGPVLLSIGANIKSVTAELPFSRNTEASATAVDYGFILQAPVIKGDLPMVNEDGARVYSYYLTPGLTMGLNNIGNEIEFNDLDTTMPLPRMASTGIHIKTGIVHYWRDQSYHLLELNWAQEAGDLLTTRNMNNAIEYKSGLGDINFFKHVLRGKSGDNMISQKGFEISLGEVLYWRNGHYEDQADQARLHTTGWGIDIARTILHTSRLFNMEGRLLDRLENIRLVVNHVKYETDIAHHYRTEEYYLPLPGTKMTSVVVSWKM